MLPTLPTQRFHHWERFDYYHPSLSPSAPPPPPPAGPAGASLGASAAAAAPHPPIGPAQAAAGENAAYWRSYHRGFGRCGRHWRGPSRLVWFGIGSLATLAIVRHKASSSGGDWPPTDGRPPFFRKSDDRSWPQAPSLGTSPTVPEPLVAPVAVAASTSPAVVDPVPAAPVTTEAHDLPRRRCGPWSSEAHRERSRSRWHPQPPSEETQQPAQQAASMERIAQPAAAAPEAEDEARKLAIELMIRSLRDLQVEQQQQAAFRPQI